jgi:omega-6 fatty acid desaturase (delta-12 desaturase)
VVPQVFQINPIKAWSAVAITLASVAASLYLISVSPWYLLPFAWFIAGTAFTGVSDEGMAWVGSFHR